MLKECPFCGSDETNFQAKYGRNGWFICARCSVCGAESKKQGLGRGADIPDVDDGFWECEKVIAACKTLSLYWNMRAPNKQNGGDL